MPLYKSEYDFAANLDAQRSFAQHDRFGRSGTTDVAYSLFTMAIPKELHRSLDIILI